MSGSSYTQVFGGSTIYPSDVSYLALALDADEVLQWPLEANTGNNLVARIIDVTPSGAHSIYLPPADQTGVGQTVLFNNLGPDVVTVRDNAGSTLLSMDQGTQWQLYLTDNSTVAGVWRTFRYGASTAQAQASALAGYGISATGSTLSQSTPVTLFNSNYTTGAADRAKAFVWTGGLGVFTLPTAVSVGNDYFVSLRNGGLGDIAITPQGLETVNDAPLLTLQPGDSVTLLTDGTNWYTLGLGQDAAFAFDYTSINVAGASGDYALSGAELNRIAYQFTGALAGNIDIVVPKTVQQYWVYNNTTGGSYTLRVKTNTQTPGVLVPRGSRAILYCDGASVVSAETGGLSVPIAILDGGTGSTSAGGALINLGGTSIGTAVFTAATKATARAAMNAAISGANTDITSLSGLTTALSIGQGGTGATTAAGALSALGAYAASNPSGYTSNVGTVTSVAASGGSTGLTFSGGPITGSGTLTLGGTLAATFGGTGYSSYTAGQLLIGTSGGSLNRATLTPGAGVSITNGDGTITIAATGGTGTVTSVDASGGSTGLTFSGGPITGSGTLTLAGTLAVAFGGTGSTTQAGAQAALDVPSRSGSGATGTWPIGVSGSAGSVATSNFSIVESGGFLYVKYGATNIARIDSSGNLIVKGNVTASGSI